MSKKGNGLLIAGAAVAAIVIVPGLLKKTEQATQGALNYFGSDGGGGIDLSWLGDLLGGGNGGGLLGGGDGGGFDIGGLFAGLGGLFSGLGLGNGNGNGNGTPFDIEAFLKSLFGGNGNDNSGTPPLPGTPNPNPYVPTPGTPDKPDWWNTPLIPSTGNTPVDWGNAISQTAMSLAKAGLTGAGIYAGVKVGVPVLNAIAPRAASALATPVSQIVGNVGRAGATITRAGASSVARAIPALGAYLTTPLSGLGAAGIAGAIPLVAAAGYGGYKVGEAFNKTAIGKALIEKSGQAGAAFARSEIGQKVYGVAQVKPLTTTQKSAFEQRWGITAEQAKTMTTAQLQAVMKGR